MDTVYSNNYLLRHALTIVDGKQKTLCGRTATVKVKGHVECADCKYVWRQMRKEV